MDFLHHPHTPLGGRVFAASVARSLGSPIQVTEHAGIPTKVRLWWSPEPVEVNPGDLVAWFVSPGGAEIECVQRRPQAAQQVGSVVTVRLS
jgi:hypothetical protein